MWCKAITRRWKVLLYVWFSVTIWQWVECFSPSHSTCPVPRKQRRLAAANDEPTRGPFNRQQQQALINGQASTKELSGNFSNVESFPSLTPYNILYPDVFPLNTSSGYQDCQRSLSGAMHILRQAVEVLAAREDENLLDTLFPSAQTIIRIEHAVVGADDPLAWLYAQEREGHASFYLADQEGNMEVAAFGAALTVHDTEKIWNIRLPEGSQWYGGQRFDQYHAMELERMPNMTAEWRVFGSSHWMIPRVELRKASGKGTVLAAHLVRMGSSLADSARDFLSLPLADYMAPSVPPTTLPPIVSRDSNCNGEDGSECFERAISAALGAFEEGSLEKVVLARLQQFQLGGRMSALDVIRRWKYGGHEGGHLFYLRPQQGSEFFGCTPERLFQVHSDGGVRSEALAGTRPRGSSQEVDEALLQELFASRKDQRENELTGNYIETALTSLEQKGLLDAASANGTSSGDFFVRRLRHVQHICRSYEAQLREAGLAGEAIRQLLTTLNPTPAVCGFPFPIARDFIRRHEATNFDRGFYSGPIGYIGAKTADVFVAIRAGLLSESPKGTTSVLTAYAGCGVVPGSTFLSEFAETNYKFQVVASLFPQSPFEVQSAPTVNVAWAASFVEELIRCGVTMFYVCPGSRSTPLVVAIARAARMHVGIVRAISIHDERAAGFRAVGYGRSAGRPAAVVTSSGTAAANLGPAVVEAGLDGVPMVLLTADRPYENRNTGANQAIDQVHIFSRSYVRWFRDVLPPSDDVPIALALADANHAVSVANQDRGPVHINMQFRENLAPEGGQIRNDGRQNSESRYSGSRFSDTPSFPRWSIGGGSWKNQLVSVGIDSVADVVQMIEKSTRGLIVVGSLRSSHTGRETNDHRETLAQIATFARVCGFPIIAGAQSCALRFSCPAVVPFAEHLLRCPEVAEALQPDLVIQIGAPILSVHVLAAITSAVKKNRGTAHVLLHPHYPAERTDPEHTVSHVISSDVAQLLRKISLAMDTREKSYLRGSELSALVLLGRKIRPLMTNIVDQASNLDGGTDGLSEPQISLALVEVLASKAIEMGLFLSNSMPVRDAEAFLYPTFEPHFDRWQGPKETGMNRGASGIDGIISSALGFSESVGVPTTLVVGDLSALYDISSMHTLSSTLWAAPTVSARKRKPLTTVVVNNDGGGIFSFLPIAKYDKDVEFEEYFGTPTKSFSFEAAAQSFGLSYERVTTRETFSSLYKKCAFGNEDSILEAVVLDRKHNVEVHRQIGKTVEEVVSQLLAKDCASCLDEKLSCHIYCGHDTRSENQKTMVLLHGWMGDKSDWEHVAQFLAENLGSDWTILAVDLPGHGDSCIENDGSSWKRDLTGTPSSEQKLSVRAMAKRVLESLSTDYEIDRIDAIVGYSLGGRVALEMKKISTESPSTAPLCGDESATVLLGAFPGQLGDAAEDQANDDRRLRLDEALGETLETIARRTRLVSPSDVDALRLSWSEFVNDWYDNTMWGQLKTHKNYNYLLEKRVAALMRRSNDLASVVKQCSPPKCSVDGWKYCVPEKTLFLSGELDTKYTAIGEEWKRKSGVIANTIPGAGHAVLLESPNEVAEAVFNFVEAKDFSAGAALPRALSNQSLETIFEVGLDESAIRSESDDAASKISLCALEWGTFVVDMVDTNRNGKGLSGIGWGDSAKSDSSIATRKGIVVQLEAEDGMFVGVGEISPLPGLHLETIQEAVEQLGVIKAWMQSRDTPVSLKWRELLQLRGEMKHLLVAMSSDTGLVRLLPSVQAGFEMALLSLAAHKAAEPLHKSLCSMGVSNCEGSGYLSVNELQNRGTHSQGGTVQDSRFSSTKVKVGHQDMQVDRDAVEEAVFQLKSGEEPFGVLRLDANRAWSMDEALAFSSMMQEVAGQSYLEVLEYIEEPLTKVVDDQWSLEQQVKSLERWSQQTDNQYALDESMADMTSSCNHNFDVMCRELMDTFGEGQRGCAVFVLKPAILGLELSFQIAAFARSELGIGTVFSSSFDSGLGLAYTGLVGYAADLTESEAPIYAHGIGTYAMLDGDTLVPAFSSYVNDGKLNIPSVSRALFGLSLDELRDSLRPLDVPASRSGTTKSQFYEAATTTSTSGSDLSVVASLPLPFPADVASARFTDLPQQSRWSPWITSVSYQNGDSEWTLNVRGIPIKWRAKSVVLEEPFPGIEWESVSGLKNRGVVEFVPESAGSGSQMNVRMSLLPPRLLQPLFRGGSQFLEEFLRDKLLKWSLEMFRDVVRADLAVERGDVELGDALFVAVEESASAIEKSLGNDPS